MFTNIRAHFTRSRNTGEYTSLPLPSQDLEESDGQIRLENSPLPPPTYSDFVSDGRDNQALLSAKEEGEDYDQEALYGANSKREGLTVCWCFGVRITCFTFWITFCLAMGLMLVASALSYAKWATLHTSDNTTSNTTSVTDTPTKSPSTNTTTSSSLTPTSFGAHLGCLAQTSFSRTTTYTVPIGKEKSDHFLNVRGGAVGTVTITSLNNVDDDEQVSAQGDNVIVEVTLQSDKKDYLDMAIVERHDPEETTGSFWRLSTPYPRGGLTALPWTAGDGKTTDEGEDTLNTDCMRYDITLRAPPSLKKLHVATHSVSHIRFGYDDALNTDAPSSNPTANSTTPTLTDLYITSYSPHPSSLLLLSTSLTSQRTNVDVTGGWVRGEVGVVRRTRVVTQRGGAGVSLGVTVLPVESAGEGEGEGEGDEKIPAVLDTITGSGPATFTVTNPPPPHHRPLTSSHLSTSHLSTLTLHYEPSLFSGAIDIRAHAVHGHNVQGPVTQDPQLGVPTAAHEDFEWVVGEGVDVDDVSERREVWSGEEGGGDAMRVRSRMGSVGLFFR